MFRLSTKVFVVYRKFRLSTNISFCLQKVPFVYKSFCCLQKVSFVHKHFLLSTKSSVCLQKFLLSTESFVCPQTFPFVYKKFLLSTKSFVCPQTFPFVYKCSCCLHKFLFAHKKFLWKKKFLLSTKSYICLQKVPSVNKKFRLSTKSYVCLEKAPLSAKHSSVKFGSPRESAITCDEMPRKTLLWCTFFRDCHHLQCRKKMCWVIIGYFHPPPHVTDLPHILTPYWAYRLELRRTCSFSYFRKKCENTKFRLLPPKAI